MVRVVVVSSVAMVVLGLVGCGVSPEDTKRVWGSVQKSLGKSGGGTRQQALSVGVDFDVDCARGGSAHMVAKLLIDDQAIDATNALFGYDVAYDACEPDDDILDGDLHYAAALQAAATDSTATLSVRTVYQGSVSSHGATNGTCDVDVVGTVDAAAGQGPGDEFQSGVSVVYSGTICGHDASETLNEKASVDVTSP